jgi:hypothetical protein
MQHEDASLRFLTSADRPLVLVGSEKERGEAMTRLGFALSTVPLNLGSELAQAIMKSESRIDVAGRIVELALGEGPLLLDHIEILFLPQLKIDVIDTLVRASRRRRLCVAWPGKAENGRLKYADHNHPEFLDADASRVFVLDLSSSEHSHK